MDEKYCGECIYMMDEDTEGRGWCALRDMYTFVDCDDVACLEFADKKMLTGEYKSKL